jgi:hypothetical protein
VPDKWAIQKINDNQAVVFNVADISREEALMSNEELLIISKEGAIDSVSEAKELIAAHKAEEQEDSISDGR